MRSQNHTSAPCCPMESHREYAYAANSWSYRICTAPGESRGAHALFASPCLPVLCKHGVIHKAGNTQQFVILMTDAWRVKRCIIIIIIIIILHCCQRRTKPRQQAAFRENLMTLELWFLKYVIVQKQGDRHTDVLTCAVKFVFSDFIVLCRDFCGRSD